MGFDVVLSHWVVTYRHDTLTCPVVQCLEVFVAFAVLSGLPLTVSCFSKIQIGFTFLVPAHLGSPEKGC